MTWGAGASGDFEILGIVENERFRGLERSSEPAVYLSTRQFPQTGVVLLLRAAQDPRTMLRDVRAGVRTVEPTATVSAPRRLADIADEQLVTRRVTADVISGFAAAALALAALGVYGVLTLIVASRTREIGVRLALGATPKGIARHVLLRSLVHALPGVALGIALAVIAGRLLEGTLVGVTGTDVSTLTAVAGTMLAAATVAALLPAMRAARVDPIDALRS
jgi:putative ABC transport system permease protein